MRRQVAKVICGAEYKVMVDTKRFEDGQGKPPYSIVKKALYGGSSMQIRKCYSLHEALGVLANILIQY